MSADILDPKSERGQQAIRNAAYLKPTTQGDPPPRPNFDDWASDIASLRENLGFDNYVALIAEALATAYDQRNTEAASAPSRPLEERSMVESPKLQVFSQAQLAQAVHIALADELPAGHTSAIVGTVGTDGIQMVIGVQKAVGVGTFTTQFVARHDWTGGNELGARVLYSW